MYSLLVLGIILSAKSFFNQQESGMKREETGHKTEAEERFNLFYSKRFPLLHSSILSFFMVGEFSSLARNTYNNLLRVPTTDLFVIYALTFKLMLYLKINNGHKSHDVFFVF